MQLPAGYRIEWGGQFQQLRRARGPGSLSSCRSRSALILFLLWLAFGRVRPALLVFVNVPFAAVGGVLALWLRGIPFSISAGVGFIALFGVAVLNGLVLVSFCLHLQERGTPPGKRSPQAAELRLRPVLMTALVAALGFLPMALSTRARQRGPTPARDRRHRRPRDRDGADTASVPRGLHAGTPQAPDSQ